VQVQVLSGAFDEETPRENTRFFSCKKRQGQHPAAFVMQW